MEKIRSLYGLRDDERLPGTVNNEPSRTQQHFKDECDINTIVAKYRATGFLTDPLAVPTRKPSFEDVSAIPDLLEAKTAMIKAGELFDALPAKVRKRFGNDPVEFVAFCSDPSNRDELETLGIIERSEPLPRPFDLQDKVPTGDAPDDSVTT